VRHASLAVTLAEGSLARVPPEARHVSGDTSDLRTRLQATLGTSYTFERELGGDGAA
jgi:hypothetical protein